MIPMSNSAWLRALAAASALAPVSVHAAAQVPTPDAGSILQQVAPPLVPPQPANAPSLQVQPERSAGLPASAPFEVKAFRISGNTAFSAEVLRALVQDQEGRSLTLSQLEDIAGRITAYYQRNGFPLSRAIIPAQSIKDGIVEIRVLEARYGAVRLHNSSAVHDPLLAATLSPLREGDPIVGPKLDRTLLLLSDIPGVVVGAVLKPGAEVGTSDLDTTVAKRSSAFANASVDNYGNRYVGRTRFGGTIDLFNPLHRGDVFNLSLVTSGRGLQYGRASYDTLLTGSGTRFGVAGSALHYKLGKEVRPLDAHGTAQVASAWIRQPIVRSRSFNISVALEYDYKRLRDRVDVADTRTDRHLNSGVATLAGDVRDGFLRGALTQWNLSWTRGDTNFDNANARAIDALTARTRGGYSKWNLDVSRLQGLTRRDTLFLSFGAQWTDSNLDSVEKVSVGGPYSVRAYDVGAISGDTDYAGTAELRHDLGTLIAGRWQVIAFVDAARVKVNHRPWTNAANKATLSGAGAGLTWEGPHLLRASATVARRIGDAPAIASRQGTTHAWATLSKAF